VHRLATKLDAFIRGKYPKFSVSTNVNGNDLFRSVTGWFKRDGAGDPNFAFYMEHQGACYTTLTFPLHNFSFDDATNVHVLCSRITDHDALQLKPQFSR
jgi:hypothetical protein